MLTFPPLVVLHLNGMLDFSAIVAPDDVAVNPVVDRLLKGEHLAPPQPLPPAAFTTREVETVRPDLVYANRKWKLLKAGFRQRLLAVYKTMQNQYGYHMVLLEGYRSPERQRKLANQDDRVTNAGAGQSYHQYGLAADSAFLRDGKVVIRRDNDWIKRGYKLYGQVAQQYGLTWGGNWSFHDYGHVELRNSQYDDPSNH
ncbi:M15 family peptidase [Salinisphaera sp. Q1T1-3]|nr:M15 family peptidase [Salinisphaera sp. Q1T1-3]